MKLSTAAFFDELVKVAKFPVTAITNVMEHGALSGKALTAGRAADSMASLGRGVNQGISGHRLQWMDRLRQAQLNRGIRMDEMASKAMQEGKFDPRVHDLAKFRASKGRDIVAKRPLPTTAPTATTEESTKLFKGPAPKVPGADPNATRVIPSQAQQAAKATPPMANPHTEATAIGVAPNAKRLNPQQVQDARIARKLKKRQAPVAQAKPQAKPQAQTAPVAGGHSRWAAPAMAAAGGLGVGVGLGAASNG